MFIQQLEPDIGQVADRALGTSIFQNSLDSTRHRLVG
jgi:hypothetical protein